MRERESEREGKQIHVSAFVGLANNISNIDDTFKQACTECNETVDRSI